MTVRPDAPWYVAKPARKAPDPTMRIGDTERNQVAEALSQHYSDGRLDATELKERLDRAIAAKTRGDLVGLLTDLPPLGPAPAPPPPRRRRVAMWAALVLLLLAVTTPWHDVEWHGQWMWFPRMPWLLIGLFALFVWSRARRRRHVPPS